jgi:hypothetical protein
VRRASPVGRQLDDGKTRAAVRWASPVGGQLDDGKTRAERLALPIRNLDDNYKVKECCGMRAQKYTVRLTNEERMLLQQFVNSKSQKIHPAFKKRARAMLHLDVNGKNPLTVEETAKKVGLHQENVYVIRKLLLTHGIERIIQRKKHDNTVPEEHIAATALSDPPEGMVRWTIKLIAERIIEDGTVPCVSYATVSRVLKKRGIDLKSSTNRSNVKPKDPPPPKGKKASIIKKKPNK